MDSLTQRDVNNKIYNASSSLLKSLNKEDTYGAIVGEALKLTNAAYGSIFMPTKRGLERVYASDERLYKIPIRKRGKTYGAYKHNRAYMLTSKELHSIHPEFEPLATGSDISVPLSYDDSTIGVLSVLSTQGQTFSQNDLDSLLYFSPIATLAINNVLAYQEIQKSLEERDLFISMASHELKTPLTTTMIYSQLLEKKLEQKEMPEEVKFIKNVFTSLKRVQALINELMQVSQIKTGELRFQKKKTDLKLVLRQIVKEAQDKYIHHKIRFTLRNTTKEFIINSDQSKIEQVVQNLIQNAAKYSPEKSTITISLKEKKDWYLIEVADKGKGISKKELPHIFERFYRGDASQATGLGLGLFIVKTIVDKHDGNITVSSKVAKGTSFTVWFKKWSEKD